LVRSTHVIGEFMEPQSKDPGAIFCPECLCLLGWLRWLWGNCRGDAGCL